MVTGACWPVTTPREFVAATNDPLDCARAAAAKAGKMIE